MTEVEGAVEVQTNEEQAVVEEQVKSLDAAVERAAAEEPIIVPPKEGEDEVADEFQVAKVFYDVYKAYHATCKAEERGSPKQEDVDELVAKIKKLSWLVDQLHLFSPNEELDDINTADLKFLLVPFLLAEILNATVDMEKRLDAVRAAIVCYRTFVQRAERYKVAAAEDLRALGRAPDERISQENKRAEKIERYKRSKELDQKVNYLFAKRRQYTGDRFAWSSPDFDEDLERDLILGLISRSVAATADAVATAYEEMPMLEMMMARGGPGAAPLPKEAPKEKPWVVRIQDKAELHKLYLQQVFQPDIPLPTMTLAEAAELEMAELDERTEREARRERDSAYEDATRWLGGDRDGSKEEWEDEMQLLKDRDWDEFKDANPYGCGNKGGNIG